MSRHVYCKDCGKPMGVIRDASLRKGMVVLCSACAHKQKAPPSNPHDMPEFLRSIFK